MVPEGGVLVMQSFLLAYVSETVGVWTSVEQMRVLE